MLEGTEVKKNKLSCEKELQFEEVNLQKSLHFFEMWRFTNLSTLSDPIGSLWWRVGGWVFGEFSNAGAILSALVNFWGSVNKLSANRKSKLSCKKELQFEDVNLQKSLDVGGFGTPLVIIYLSGLYKRSVPASVTNRQTKVASLFWNVAFCKSFDIDWSYWQFLVACGGWAVGEFSNAGAILSALINFGDNVNKLSADRKNNVNLMTYVHSCQV